MSACAQCGTIANQFDKFCNTCGAPVNRAPAPGQPAAPAQGAPAPQASPQYGAPPPAQYGQPPQPQGFGAPPPQQYGQPQQQYGAPSPQARPARCQMGHDIAPGASYCPQGHPIALDAMQFAGDPQAQQYGAPPPQQYGAPPVQQYGAPPPQPQGFGGPTGGMSPFDATQMPPPPQAFGPSQQYGAPQPPQQQQGFGAPQQQPQGGFGPPQGFGAPQPAQPQGFGAPQQAFQPPPQPPPAPAFAPPPPPGFSPGAQTTPDPVPQVAPGARVLRGFLVSFQSNGAGEFWPLHSGRTTVGRANAGDPPDIPLADATISSRHAVFLVDGGTGSVQVEDTNSTNGTYVNEEHIGMNGKRELRDGDRVRFGGFTTIVKCIGRVA